MSKLSLYLPMNMLLFSHFSHLLVMPWTVAHQAPLSMGFSAQEFRSGFLCPPPEDLPNPGIKPTCPVSSTLQPDSLPLSHQGSPYYKYTTSQMSNILSTKLRKLLDIPN